MYDISTDTDIKKLIEDKNIPAKLDTSNIKPNTI